MDKSVNSLHSSFRNILVIGYNSYIGKEICKTLLINGYNVISTVTKSIPKKKISPHLNIIKLDLTLENTYKNIKEDIDVIINCASLSNQFFNNKKKLYENNIVGSKKLRKFCNKFKPELLIHLSSMSVYGNKNFGKVNHKTKLKSNSIYGSTKKLEEKIFSYKNNYFSTISIRLPGVLNKSSKYSLIPKIYLKLIKDETVYIYNRNNLFNNMISTKALSLFIINIFLLNNKKIFHYTFPLGTKNTKRIELVINYMKKLLNSNSKIIYLSKKNNYHYIDNSFAIKKFNYNPETTYRCIRNYIESICK